MGVETAELEVGVESGEVREVFVVDEKAKAELGFDPFRSLKESMLKNILTPFVILALEGS